MTYDQRPPNPDDPVEPDEPIEPVDDGTEVVEPAYPDEPAQPAQAPPPPAAYVPPAAAPPPAAYVAPAAPPPAAPPPAYTQPAASNNVNVAPAGTAVAAGPGPLYYARRVLSLLFGILITLLILRIVLLLLVADPNNGIVDFVYSVTEPFVAPFRGMFQFDAVASGDRTLDIAALVALIGWTLIYALIMAVLRLADRSTS
jgi:uncharacterized protein YggT (Ycf19 family)